MGLLQPFIHVMKTINQCLYQTQFPSKALKKTIMRWFVVTYRKRRVMKANILIPYKGCSFLAIVFATVQGLQYILFFLDSESHVPG